MLLIEFAMFVDWAVAVCMLEGANEARGLGRIIMRRDEKSSFIFWMCGSVR